jgi:glycine--tRNA ligase
MEDIISLCKRRGFIYQGSDVYGGLSGTWDYGPLGVQLKRNIMNLWWRRFVDERDDMYGVDAAILMNQKVWKASGHVDTFSDPLVECNNCKSRFRFDKLDTRIKYDNFLYMVNEELESDKLTLEEKLLPLRKMNQSSDPEEVLEAKRLAEEMNLKDEAQKIDKRIEELKDGYKYRGSLTKKFLEYDVYECEKCGSCDWSEAKPFNMMFKTTVGPVADEGSVSYLRPETAQGIFTNFKNVVDSFYPNLPFGIAQQGKAFRNEIAPRDFVFRSREFEQMEIEYFVIPPNRDGRSHEKGEKHLWEEAFDELLEKTREFLAELGLNPDHINELDVLPEDRAHYSDKTIDIEYDYPIGQEELMGIAYRTDFDLMNIQCASGKSMEYTVKGTNTKFVPHVIEPSFGVERALMAVLSGAYREDEQNGEKRVYLALPEHLAPVKFAVSPLLKNKPELVEKARDVYAALAKANPGRVMWDDNGNIGKRYRRQDEIGTPHCVVIDFQTLEDGTVTVRERDTTEQRRVKIEEL